MAVALINVPFNVILSVDKLVKVPTEVILGWLDVAIVPLIFPKTVKEAPILTDPLIPTPPDIINAPVDELVELVVSFINTLPEFTNNA